MTPLIAAIYVIPPVLAIILSLRATSKFAGAILLTAGFGSLVVFAALQLAYLDCEYSDFAFANCGVLPIGTANAMTMLHMVFALLYLFAGPVLLVFTAVIEMVARSRR